MISYGRQTIDGTDIEQVVETLRSAFLTQGPRVEEFEKLLAEYCGAAYAVVVANGTAALQAAYYAIGIQPGDEFITSPMTFPATCNAARWFGAKPVFVDIDPLTGNIDHDLIENKITAKTKAIVPIDFAGRPAELEKIKTLAAKHNLSVIEDACQALGAKYHGQMVGSLSDLTVFSFHPVKTITTGEGGAILTNNESFYKKMKMFITHGVVKENFEYSSPGEWYFEMQDLGQNYRLTDMQCALGIGQLKKADKFVAMRREKVARYSEAFKENLVFTTPLSDTPDAQSAWHLYVIQLKEEFQNKQSELFSALRQEEIWVQLHHIPVHCHPYYRHLGYQMGITPQAENFYKRIMSLPLYPDLSPQDQEHVIKTVLKIVNSY